MVGIFKTNNIETIGGTTPQGDSISLGGDISGWNVVEMPDDMISSVQEFDIQPVSDDFIEAINGPMEEGAYNAPAYEIGGTGDKLRIENNPGQVNEDGNPIVSVDDADDQSQKNFTSEDVKAYKDAYRFIKKYNAKTLLRNDIRGNVKDVEDDIADAKTALQVVMYYFANEWNSRNATQKANNPQHERMDRLTSKLLNSETKMRADLSDGFDKLETFIKEEEKINKLVSAKYKYNSQRGA
jgi:hypothetical protein